MLFTRPESESYFISLCMIRNFIFGLNPRKGTRKHHPQNMGTLIFMEECYQDAKEMAKITSDLSDYWQVEELADFMASYPASL